MENGYAHLHQSAGDDGQKFGEFDGCKIGNWKIYKLLFDVVGCFGRITKSL